MISVVLNRKSSYYKLITKDILLITIMAVLAACGLIYQYLLSSYAGRVLGIMEHAIFTMIGVMIVSMGIGSFAAKLVKCPFSGFAWLELLIAFFGATGILIIGAAFVFSEIFPEIIANTYGMPPDLIPSGGIISTIRGIVEVTPYIIGFIIGLLVGMEIPFIARVRQHMYNQHLEHNVRTIYGADYIGAGIGAAIFILFMLQEPPEVAAVYTAAVNLVAGLAFFLLFYKKIYAYSLVFLAHLVLLVGFVFLSYNVKDYNRILENTLFEDQVVLNQRSDFQQITLTKLRLPGNSQPIYSLFLNGRTQFSSLDEHIYHDFMVHPAMMASARRDNILIVGGGDGLALREVLRWDPKNVTVLELDREMIELFSIPKHQDGVVINQPLLELNNYAFLDPRVEVLYGDAFNSADILFSKNQSFDTIIVDLPDPSHPNLNKLYSVQFYKKLLLLLSGDGALSIQSTSPYHAKDAFLTVGVTLKASGFGHVERYRHNVPSFGEWGWTIASKMGKTPKQRIEESEAVLPSNSWITKDLMLASFQFSRHFFRNEA
ncbi:MAG: polyamine aminopropyltransferase, partial [Rickettsiales bacterium]|nr:polyamine aminopropyltransferase [Rickettsiales bacterium]